MLCHVILCYIFTVYNGRACHLVFLALSDCSFTPRGGIQIKSQKEKSKLNKCKTCFELFFVICRFMLSRGTKISDTNQFLVKKSVICFLSPMCSLLTRSLILKCLIINKMQRLSVAFIDVNSGKFACSVGFEHQKTQLCGQV